MTKYNIPLNLTKYTIENNKTTIEQVEQELRNLINWMKTNQNTYYQNNFDQLIQRLKQTNEPIKGSLNSFGRKLGIEPLQQHSYQPYNTAEMFRTSILMKTSGYLQNDLITDIIYEFNVDFNMLKPIDIINKYKELYPSHKKPTFQFVRRTIDRLNKTGVMHGIPKGDGVLPFWATDTHYSKITNDNKHIYFSLKLDNIGQLTLKFNIPQKDRFMNGDKITRPNVYLDKNNNIKFGFTIQKEMLKPKGYKNYLGIDLGIVESFVGTVITNNSYSAPIYANKKINILNNKISKLKLLSNQLFVKEELNRLNNHDDKYEVLRIERLRVRSKVSRLKVEKSHYIANQIITIAAAYNAVIVFEDLSWVPHSKWDQARVQETTMDKAMSRGLKVRKVNPANTSNLCILCSSRVKHSGRSTKCLKCSKILNRDILASRNIANKLGKKDFNTLCQLSVITRSSKPVTPGHYNHFVDNSKIYNKTD